LFEKTDLILQIIINEHGLANINRDYINRILTQIKKYLVLFQVFA